MFDYINRNAVIVDNFGTFSAGQLVDAAKLRTQFYATQESSAYFLADNASFDTIATLIGLVAAEKTVFFFDDIQDGLPGIHLQQYDRYGTRSVLESLPKRQFFLRTRNMKKVCQMGFDQIVGNAEATLRHYTPTHGLTILNGFPPASIFSLTTILMALISGEKVVLAPWSNCHAVSESYVLHCTPDVLTNVTPTMTGKIHQILSAGSMLSQNTVEALGKVAIFEAYGLVESCGIVAIGPYGRMHTVLPEYDVFPFMDELHIGGNIFAGYWEESLWDQYYFPSGDIGDIAPWDIVCVKAKK